MFKQSKKIVFLLLIVTVFSLAGCGSYDFAETGNEIIQTTDAISFIGNDDIILVDTQAAKDFEMSHIKGAVNIPLSDIVISEPIANMMAPKEKIEKTLENAGISNDSVLLIYDDINNMDAARLWFTLKYYGHEDAKVIGGGLKVLLEEGAETETGKVDTPKGNYKITVENTEMIANLKEVRNQLNEPSDNVRILDVRSIEEYNEGTIPTSIHLNYIGNNYSDGEYKKTSDIQIMYIDNDIKPENEVIMYCKTSIRAAQSYLALYNAGYRNIKIYDGAWLEYCSYSFLPVQLPEANNVEFNQQDNS